MNLTRRSFIMSSAAAAVSAAAAPKSGKTVDGGYSAVSPPGIPQRGHPVLPPGAGSASSFARKCVGCQLCVKACPNKVLRRSKGRNFPRPEMGFDKGWCRSECVKCSEVCPAGAIRRVKISEKKDIRAGCAKFHKDSCLAASEEVRCTICFRHCPQKAITLVPLDRENPQGPKIPVVDETKCTGCGACEHLCPARPLPGLVVEGYTEHRETHPAAVAAAHPHDALWQGLRLA